MARTGLSFALCIVALSTLAAFEPTLDPGTLADAIYIGQSRVSDTRSLFHMAYHVNISKPPVDYVEIVTPFRRVALDAEARTRAGERLSGQREALEILGDDPSRLDAVVELTFHPLNTFVGVPDYGVTLLPATGETAIEPRQINRIPRFGPRLPGTSLPYPYTSGQPAREGSLPLLGGSLIATFDGRAISPRGTNWVVISEAGMEVARARVDFGELR